jgi:hypothetical protein
MTARLTRRLTPNKMRHPATCEIPRPDAGAPGLTRTADTRFRKPLLYPLSYGGV